MSATKHDQDKPRLDLVPGRILKLVSCAYTALDTEHLDRAWERGGKVIDIRGGAETMLLSIHRSMQQLGVSMIEAQARVMEFGALKYGEHNYLQGGFAWSRLIAAARRHVVLGQGCQPLSICMLVPDQETDQPHLAHAACMLTFLIEHTLRGLGENDQWPA